MNNSQQTCFVGIGRNYKVTKLEMPNLQKTRFCIIRDDNSTNIDFRWKFHLTNQFCFSILRNTGLLHTIKIFLLQLLARNKKRKLDLFFMIFWALYVQLRPLDAGKKIVCVKIVSKWRKHFCDNRSNDFKK